jgi:hypothetical protein
VQTSDQVEHALFVVQWFKASAIFGVINDDDLNQSTASFELQTELLLKGRHPWDAVWIISAR